MLISIQEKGVFSPAVVRIVDGVGFGDGRGYPKDYGITATTAYCAVVSVRSISCRLSPHCLIHVGEPWATLDHVELRTLRDTAS